MIYKSYLFTTSLLNWLAITIVLIFLIWFSRAVAFLDLITENGIDIGDFFYLFLLILPWILIYILPISFFISNLTSLNKLIHNSEIIILKNCGLSNIKIAKPFIFFGFIITIFCYLLSFYLMPLANKKMRISKHNIQENYTNISFNPQTFENFNKITIFSQNRDEKNNLSGILINDNRRDDFAVTLTAEYGTLMADENSVFLRLKNGTLQRYNIISKKTEILRFDSYVFNLNDKDSATFNYKWKPNERFIYELVNYESGLDNEQIQNIKVEFHKRINDPLISLVFAIIICSSILNANFSRNNNFLHLVLTLVWCLIYIVLLIFSYRLSSKYDIMTYLPYIINGSFFLMSLWSLTSDSRYKNRKYA